jgi:hypothetical protein
MDELCITARVAAERARRCGGRLTELAIDLGDDNLCTFLGEALGGGAANPRSRPGDDGDFPSRRGPRILRPQDTALTFGTKGFEVKCS